MVARLIHLLSIMVTMMVSSSCIRDIVLDSKDRPVIAVECILSDTTVQKLNLSFAKTPSEAIAKPLDKAKVTLTDITEGRLIGEFKKIADGSWELQFRPVSSHRYGLDVYVDGYDAIHAEDTMVETIRVHMENYSNPFADFYFHTPSEDGPYGWMKTYGTYYRPVFSDFVWAYGYNKDPDNGKTTIVPEICTDYPFVDSFNLTGTIYDGNVEYLDIDNEDEIVYAKYVFPTLIGYPYHKTFLRFPSNKDDKTGLFTISGNFTNYYDKNYSNVIVDENSASFVRFMSVSEAYDHYLRDAIYYKQLQDSSDITTLYMNENMFSNIEGGVGIFATASIVDVPWACLRYTAKMMAE